MAIEQKTRDAGMPHTSGQLSTFFVADMFFGVDVLQVQEVLRFQHMTRVPQAPEVIEGLINLRGQIVTAIDMRRCLGQSNLDADRQPMNVVVRTDDGAISLLVDEIGDVLDVEEDAFEPPPATLQGEVRALIQGVYKLQNRLLLVLDTERALEVSARAC